MEVDSKGKNSTIENDRFPIPTSHDNAVVVLRDLHGSASRFLPINRLIGNWDRCYTQKTSTVRFLNRLQGEFFPYDSCSFHHGIEVTYRYVPRAPPKTAVRVYEYGVWFGIFQDVPKTRGYILW